VPASWYLAGSRVDSVQRKSKLERYGGTDAAAQFCLGQCSFCLSSRILLRVQTATDNHVINEQYFERFHLPTNHTETNVADNELQGCGKNGPMVRLWQDGVPVLGFTW